MTRARIRALGAALNLTPDDWAARLVLADLLEEEHETTAAQGQRWQAENETHPHHYLSFNGGDAPFPWAWVSEDGPSDALPHAGLPEEVRREVGFREWTAYHTRRAAEDSLACALTRLRDTAPGRCPACNATMARCGSCGAEWCLDHQTRPLTCPGCGARPGGVGGGEGGGRGVT
jgi:hypothetical protein